MRYLIFLVVLASCFAIGFRSSEQPPAPAAPASDEDAMAKLTQLKSLLDQGVLTQAEFDMQKQKILMTM